MGELSFHLDRVLGELSFYQGSVLGELRFHQVSVLDALYALNMHRNKVCVCACKAVKYLTESKPC